MSSTTLYDQFVAEYELQQQSNEANDRLSSLRKDAFIFFKETGFPTTKWEEWKYTNVQPFLKAAYNISSLNQTTTTLNSSSIPALDAQQIIIHNGRLANDSTQTQEGVSVVQTETIPVEKFQQYIENNSSLYNSPFVALNTAFLNKGVFIEIDKNCTVEKPIHIVHKYDTIENTFIQPYQLIVLNENSFATIVESTIVANDKQQLFINSVSKCILKEGSGIEIYRLQTGKKNNCFISYSEVMQHINSVCNHFTFTFPCTDFVRNDLHIDLLGSHTESHLYGFYLVNDNQLVDNHTKVDHQQPYCISNELYKGVLLDNAKAVFNGKIYVHRVAQKTNAFQKNNNLLLSDGATIDSKPQLEIFADDVKCSHGSTIGCVNKEALFYLQTRGIGKEAAQNLLINAFAYDVTCKIKIPALRKYVEKLIAENH